MRKLHHKPSRLQMLYTLWDDYATRAPPGNFHSVGSSKRYPRRLSSLRISRSTSIFEQGQHRSGVPNNRQTHLPATCTLPGVIQPVQMYSQAVPDSLLELPM